MDFTIEGKIRFSSERGSYRMDVIDTNGNEYGVTANVPQLGSVLRTLEYSSRQLNTPSIDPIAQQAVEFVAGPDEDGKAFVRRCYDLTTRFHQKTGQKVQIADICEAFFVNSMKDVEGYDREAFERRLIERLEKQVPGWDNA